MFTNGKRIATVLFGFCATVIILLALAPWIDWARHGDVWVANLAALPAVPGVLMLFGKSWFA